MKLGDPVVDVVAAHQMPVQSRHCVRMQRICDRLAVLASQCCRHQRDQRYSLLRKLCDAWATTGEHRPISALRGARSADVDLDISSQLSPADAVACWRDVSRDETSLKDSCQTNGDCSECVTAVDRTNCPSECDNSTHSDEQCPVEQPAVTDQQCPVGKCPASVPDLQPYVCCICQTSLDCPNALRTHMTCQHGDVTSAQASVDSCDVDTATRHARGDGLPLTGECKRESSTTSGTRTLQSAVEASRRCRTPATTHSRPRRRSRRLQCPDCGAGDFPTWKARAVHRRRSHAATLPHACQHCARRFLYASELRKHAARHADVRRRYACADCGQGFRRCADLRVHGAAVHGGSGSVEPLTCGVCERWMSSAQALRAHARIHRPDAPRDAACAVCHRRFSYLSSLRAHVKRIHPLGTPAAAPSDVVSKSHHVDDADSGRTTTSLRLAIEPDHAELSPQHSAEFTERSEEASKPGAEMSRIAARHAAQLARWQRKYPGRKIEPFACELCGEQFLQRVQLRKHTVKHDSVVTRDSTVDGARGGRLHACAVCARRFLFATDLRRHLVSHSDLRPHVCGVCTRPFKRRDDLAKHVKLRHAGEGAAAVDAHCARACDECAEQLPSARELRRHMRAHHHDHHRGPADGPHQSQCTLCHLVFDTRAQLTAHRRQRHAGETGGQYMCDRCGQSYSDETDLRAHLYSAHARRRADAVHACPWCARRFASTSHLAAHERTHTKDRPFTCDECGKQFTQCGSLNVHRRTHSDPQPFACAVCAQRFASKQYLRKHEAIKHPARPAADAADDVCR